MLGFFRKKIKSVNDIRKLIESQEPEKAGQTLRAEADKGNFVCQVFLSQMYLDMMDRETNNSILKDLTKKFVAYSVLAANQGDADTQYNLAKHYMNVASADIRAGGGKLSEAGRDILRESKKYLGMASAQGLEQAKEALSNLNELCEWAETQEYI
ncbi:hypothetical protein [Pseudomonas putida]|uniref:hypothetical protein n=1 Tax=Pseudomonas putida TaxID=303 RepID=UPI0038227655